MHLKTGSPRIRSAEGSKGGLLLLLVTSAVWVSRISKLYAGDSSDHSFLETSDHPYLEAKDSKSEACLKCHPAKNQGKFVHTAVGKGCESCHQVASADDKTTITLRATGGELCSKCHEINQDTLLHGPYKAGQCLLCHNPHTGAYPAQTRAAVSTLCLGCHMLNQPDTRVNAESKTVTLLDGMTYDLASWESAPKISAGHFENSLPHSATAPATVRESGKLNPEPNCLACHDPHLSQTKHLLRKAADARDGTENLSREASSNFMGIDAVSQIVAAHQDPGWGGQR